MVTVKSTPALVHTSMCLIVNCIHTKVTSIARKCIVCRTMHMLPYADAYAAMFISGPVCRMRPRTQMRVYSGKVWTNIGGEMQICDG